MIPLTRQIFFAGKNSATFLCLLSSSQFWFASKTVSLPFLAESIREGTIKAFDRREGQWVNQDEPIAQVQTEKAHVTVRSPHSGLITKCHVKVGDKLQIGGPLLDVDLDAKKPEHEQKSDYKQSQTQSADSSSSKSESGQNVGSSAIKTQYGQSHNVGFDTDKPSPGQNKSQTGQNIGFDTDKSYSKQSQPQTAQNAGLNSAQNLGSDFDLQLPSGYANSANPNFATNPNPTIGNKPESIHPNKPDPTNQTKPSSTKQNKPSSTNATKPESTNQAKPDPANNSTPESKQKVRSNPTKTQSDASKSN